MNAMFVNTSACARSRKHCPVRFLSRFTVSLSLVLLLALPAVSGAVSRDKRLAGNVASSPGLGVPALVAQSIRQALSDASGAGKTVAESIAFPRDETTGTPIFMNRGVISQLSRRAGKTAQGTSPAETAMNFILLNRDVFQLDDPKNELAVLSEENTPDGRSHILFEQRYQGYPVWGKRLALHFDADGSIYAMNGRYVPTPKAVDLAGIRLSGTDAIEKASGDLSRKTPLLPIDEIQALAPGYSGPSSRLVIRAETGETPVPVWQVTIRPNLREEWQYFLDAGNGGILEAYNDIPDQTMVNATATDALGVSRTFPVAYDNTTYSLMSTNTNIMAYDAHGKVIKTNSDMTLITSASNAWTDSIAVSAYWNGTQTYDYYLREHNRNGLDGKNMKTPMVVHYTEDGTPYDNAFWAGQYMAFGDAQPFAEALDVVAHEMTHAVTQFTVGLEYRFRSGALNEAISDVMACMVDSTNWTMGEILPGGAIRDVEHPEKYGLPADMAHYKNLSINTDNGGVHINMGIPSRAYALTADTIGRNKTARILYRVLDSIYITPQAQFVDMRLGAVQASTDLFGADSPETAAVKTSFDTVGILDGAPTAPPTDTVPPVGGEWIAFLDQGYLKLGRPVITGSGDLLTISTNGVYTDSGRPIAVARDGKRIIFVDRSNNLRSFDLEKNQETLLDSQGAWSSVALSPGGSLLAATSTYADTSIYIFDLNTPANSKQIHLYTPSTEGVKAQTMLYADALDWDDTGTNILFDAFNSLPAQGGAAAEFWDINLLDVGNEIISRVKTPTENDYQVGNPSFAETNDRYIVCDLFSTTTQYNAVVSFDLFTLNEAEIRNNGFINTGSGPFPNVGIPRYSPDDTAVIYQHYNPGTQSFTLSTIPLAADKMTPAGNPSFYHSGEIPVWFVQETTVVTAPPEPPANVQVSDVQDDQGYFLKINWTLSPSDHNGGVSKYRIFHSRSSTLTNPIPMSSFPTRDSLIVADAHYTILVDSVAAGVTQYVDFVPVNGETYYVWLQAVGPGGVSKMAAGIRTAVTEIPRVFSLSPPYPNPFNPSTTIGYVLPENARVLMKVFTITGQQVAVLANGIENAGKHSALWNASGMPSGVYIYAFTYNGKIHTGKMTLLK